MFLSHPQYKMLFYSLDGRLLAAYSAYEWSLGIKSVAWSPSSQFLAVGSYDGKVGDRPGQGTPPEPPEQAETSVVLSSGAAPEPRDLEDDHRVRAPRGHQQPQDSESRVRSISGCTGATATLPLGCCKVCGVTLPVPVTAHC